MIHKTAIIDEGTVLDSSIEVGPYAVIEQGVVIGAGSTIGAHAVIHRGCQIGSKVTISPHVVLGGDPQHLGFDRSQVSGVKVEDGATVREYAIIHRATVVGGFTVVGAGAYVMTCVHIGHDSVIGERAIVASGAILGGFVTLGAGCFLGGNAGLHQHVRVGKGSMIGGGARITLDVPPFTMVTERNELSGLNLVGLKRAGATISEIQELKQAFRAVCGSIGNFPKRAEAYEASLESMATSRVSDFLLFFKAGKRGFSRPGGDAGR